MGDNNDVKDVCPSPVAWIGARAGALGVSSAMERNELPDNNKAASFVERVNADNPWFICSGNLKSMETVLANCAIAITAYILECRNFLRKRRESGVSGP